MTQFWVRKAGSRGMLFGGKELKEKKKYGQGRILHQMFHFRGSNCRRTEPPGGRSAVPTSGGLLPRSAARVRAGSQIPTNPDASPVPASLSCSDHSLVPTPPIPFLHFFDPFKAPPGLHFHRKVPYAAPLRNNVPLFP